MLSKGRLLILILLLSQFSFAQSSKEWEWTRDGKSFTVNEEGEIVKYTLPSFERTVLVSKDRLIPAGSSRPLGIESYFFSSDDQKLLIFNNTKRVWRLNTKGDYWLIDLKNRSLKKIGKNRPSSSLMFAKFSPDGSKVAYVSEYNLYVEDLISGKEKQLTTNGNRKFINGTFDWVYEEEFFCRDGFRWSSDSRQLAYWQIDAGKTKDYIMINHTDSIYPAIQPVEYPVVGEPPSPFRIGVVDVNTAQTKWMNIPGDPVLGTYVPRMEWIPGKNELIIQHLNRKQNQSDLMVCNTATGQSKVIFREKDSAWIDITPSWDQDYIWGGWDWLSNGKEFLWASEKDGWRHLYRIGIDGKNEMLVTQGIYDVMDISAIDEKNSYVYFFASLENATQKYLYRTRLDGSGKAERVTPQNQSGTHDYSLSPTALFAFHSFSNHYTPSVTEWVSIPEHRSVNGRSSVDDAISKADKSKYPIEFFKVKTTDGIEMDAWMIKPANLDPAKKYPVIFYVYTEPWGQEVKDQFGIGNNHFYLGNMSTDGYYYIAIDNRGTPVPKGRNWRKSIHRKIGLVNIRDQAMAALEILKWPTVDSSRIAVWGHSGGGNATLNLMFQYPEIYKTGIAMSSVVNQLTYDNIYQERYMGLPQENKDDFLKGSPLTYAKNLRGNLLYVHGTGDDNVHYNNAEMLINELVKHNRQFQFMPYPNRTHGITEGAGTKLHLMTLYTNYLKKFCPPGGR